MSERAQLKHVLLDVGFKDKPTILELEETHKPLARLLYMDALAAMSQGTDAKISRVVFRALGKRIGLEIEKIDEILEYCLNKELIQLEGELLTNSRVIKDQEQYHRKLSSGKKKPSAGQKCSDEKEKCPLPDIDSDYDIDTDSVDLKKKESPPRAEIPHELRPALRRWVDYRFERKPKLTRASIDQIVKKYEGRPDDLARDVDYSISQGWQGLYPPDSKNARAGPQLKPSQNLVNQMVSQKAVEQIIREERQNDTRRDSKNPKQSVLALPEPYFEPGCD